MPKEIVGGGRWRWGYAQPWVTPPCTPQKWMSLLEAVKQHKQEVHMSKVYNWRTITAQAEEKSGEGIGS